MPEGLIYFSPGQNERSECRPGLCDATKRKSAVGFS